MRKIKFRGKRLDNGEWVHGDLLQIVGGFVIYHGSHTDCTLIEDRPNLAIELYMDEVSPVHPDTVGQFTGLCDCNGREIYEGDVIKSMYNDIYHVIGYNESRGAFTATLINEYMNNTDGLKTECNAEQKWLADCKKIIAGNMFDTPSLLKGGKP